MGCAVVYAELQTVISIIHVDNYRCADGVALAHACCGEEFATVLEFNRSYPALVTRVFCFYYPFYRGVHSLSLASWSAPPLLLASVFAFCFTKCRKYPENC